MEKNTAKNKMVADYLTGEWTNGELARKYGIATTTVRNTLIKAGVYKPQRWTRSNGGDIKTEVTLKEMWYQRNVQNPYPEGSQSNAAYKKGFEECFNHFFKQ